MITSLTNWGNKPVLIKKQSKISQTELVAPDNLHWRIDNARVHDISRVDREESL